MSVFLKPEGIRGYHALPRPTVFFLAGYKLKSPESGRQAGRRLGEYQQLASRTNVVKYPSSIILRRGSNPVQNSVSIAPPPMETILALWNTVVPVSGRLRFCLASEPSILHSASQV